MDRVRKIGLIEVVFVLTHLPEVHQVKLDSDK